MKRCSLIALAALAACHAAKGPAEPLPKNHLTIQVLLDEPMARSAHMEALLDQVTVTPSRLAMIADRRGLYLVGWGGAKPVDTGSLAFDAFDYTPDGLLMAIRGKQLFYLDPDAHWSPLYELPSDGMGLMRTDSAVLLYDRTSAGHPAVYELDAGKRVRKLFDSPRPIDAIAQGGSHIYFAVDGIVFDAVPGQRMHMVASLPGVIRIRYLAASPDGARIFISDGDSIYVLDGPHATLVTASVGGAMRMQGDALLVLDHKRRLLARIAGM